MLSVVGRVESVGRGKRVEGGGRLYIIGTGAGPKNFSVKDEISRVSKRAQQREQ